MIGALSDFPVNKIDNNEHQNKPATYCATNKAYSLIPAKSYYQPRGQDDTHSTITNATTNSTTTNATNNSTTICLHHTLPRVKMKPKVSFSNVEIRRYETILGDNPACCDGPSLSIGWKYYPDLTVSLSLNNYEQNRSVQLLEKYQLLISRCNREMIVRDLGYTDQELVENMRLMNKIKFQRTQTVNNLPVAKMEEVVEQAREKMKKMLYKQKKRKMLLLIK